MQSVSNKYKSDSIAGIRQLSWQMLMATDKRLQLGINLWVWDVSVWDGGDVWAGDDNVLTEWSRYRYYDYSDRLVGMEWERQLSLPYSSARAFGSFDMQNADGFLNYSPVAKTESLTEDFSLPLDPKFWLDWSGGKAVVSGGQLSISTATTSGYFGIESIYRYDLTGSFLQCEIVDAGNQSLVSYEPTVELSIDADNKIYFVINQGTIVAGKAVGGVSSILEQITYNSTTMRWVKLREASGTVYWEYSSDGGTWSELYSETAPIDITKLKVDIFVGTFNNEGVVTTAIFDNVNTDASGEPVGEVVSPVGQYMIPGRPFRLLAGFSGEVTQGIVGVTTDAPEYNERERIVSFHGHDFFGRVCDTTLDVGMTIESMTTGEALEDIFINVVGLQTGQFVLDSSFNEIAFTFYEASTKLGDIFDELMQAEIGRLFMDETGTIRFYNRERLVGDPIITLDKTNIVELEQERQTNIANSIEVISNPQVVQDFQTVFDLQSSEDLPIGNSEFFFDFSVDNERVPVVEINAITTYTANTASDGSGTNITGSVSIVSTELLGDTVKVTISNISGLSGYLTSLEITGRPAIRQPEIRATAKNQESIDDFEERKITIENDLIQSQSDANSLAFLMLFYTQAYNNSLRIRIKSIPALQNGDAVTVEYGSIQSLMTIEKVTFKLDESGFTQYLTVRRSPIQSLNIWVWDVSTWDGGDVWGF